MPQSGNGIDARGAPRGNVAGKQRYRDQQNSHRAKGDRIGRAHNKEHTGEQTRDAQRYRDARSEADKHESRGLAENLTQNIRGSRAKGHADTDLARPAGNRVGNDAEDSRSRQNQGYHAKQSDEPGTKPRLRDTGV